MLRFTPIILITLASCGGGSDSAGTVQGLQAPQQVTIVEAAGNSSSPVILASELRGLAGSDYETDQTRYWIEDDSMQALDTVNMILSSLQQTQYWEQTNSGAYLALIADEDRGGGGERGAGIGRRRRCGRGRRGRWW